MAGVPKNYKCGKCSAVGAHYAANCPVVNHPDSAAGRG